MVAGFETSYAAESWGLSEGSSQAFSSKTVFRGVPCASAPRTIELSMSP